MGVGVSNGIPVLANDHPVNRMLIEDAHRRLIHAGRLNTSPNSKATKGKQHAQEIQPYDLVKVHQANTLRAFWKLGRITEVFRSKDDGVVRAANVKTDQGILKRSTAHLYHLEQSDHDLDACENETVNTNW